MYGIGGVVCTVLLERVQQQPMLVFLGGVVICTVVEYVGGSVCDRLFGTLSWDYRGKPLHLNGKICLQYSCCWGLLAGLIVYGLKPVIVGVVGRLDPNAGGAVLTAALALVLACVALTTAALVQARQRLDALLRDAGGLHGPGRRSAVGGLISLLAPDVVLINTFPRTRLADELSAVSGQQRRLITLPAARPVQATADRWPAGPLAQRPVPCAGGAGEPHARAVESLSRAAAGVTVIVGEARPGFQADASNDFTLMKRL